LLTESQADAEGFARTLAADLRLGVPEQRAFDRLFERPVPAEVEAGNIVYYAGHGSSEGPVFASKGSGDGIVRSSEAQLGSRGLAYVVFDCCKALKPEKMTDWAKIFDGLHYLLGFNENIQPSEKRGAYFATHLRQPQPQPFSVAWRRAGMESEKVETGVMPWSSLRAIPTDGPDPGDEIWSDLEPLAAFRPGAFMGCWESLLDQLQPLPPPPGPHGSVKLFRTLPPDAEARLSFLAAKFGLVGAPRFDKAGSTILRQGESALEYYPRSGSFWWRDDQGRDPALARIPDGPLPSRPEILAKGRAALGARNLQDDRADQYFLTETRCRTFRADGPLAPSVVVAGHVDHLFQVDGLLVMGPGARMRVVFSGDEAGEIVKYWREPEGEHPPRTVDIITMEEAEALLRSHESFVRIAPEKVQITGRRLGYYSLPPREAQDHLLPIYSFEGTVSSPETPTQPALEYGFVRYVQAAVPDFRDSQPASSVFRGPTVFA
jgi:uncharacterized protein DUF6345